MGNCLNPASKHIGLGLTMEEEEESLAAVKRISQEEQAAEVDAEEAAAEGLKVKVVLTRAELEWLMAQLKSGERRLEDVIHHIHAAAVVRGAKDGGGGWRPRLESIIEAPGDAAATAY